MVAVMMISSESYRLHLLWFTSRDLRFSCRKELPFFIIIVGLLVMLPIPMWVLGTIPVTVS